MTKKKPDLDHTILTATGACAACQFLRTAIAMSKVDEYRAEYQRLLAEAQELHARQISLWEVTK